jgi:CubicO group peptidase (beta-lactamase class C family)
MREPPSGAGVARILADRVDRHQLTAGIVAGIVSPAGRRFHAHGRVSEVQPVPPDGSTVFEAGSVTKVITALLLADMAVRGEVGLDDAVASHLPGIDDHGITLRHLATHTAGLPSMLPGFAAAHAREAPDFTTDDLLAEFDHWAPPRAAGERFEYSNTGYAILGTALSRKANLPFEALIHTRICQPNRAWREAGAVLAPEQVGQLGQGDVDPGLTAPAERRGRP